MGARRLLCSVFVVVVGVLVFASAPAFAEIHRGFTGHLAGRGSGAGQLEEPQGVAVNDATGDVYVVDKGNNRVDEFEANGTFVRAWGWGVADGITEKFQTCTITCSKGLAGAGEGQLDAPEAIAVDDSGKSVAEDPSVGDVYVTNTADNVVEKFGASGEYKGEISTGAGGAPFSGLLGVAVSPTGVLGVYVGVAETNGAEIDSYSDAEPNVLSTSDKSLAGGNVFPGFAVDSTGNFYVMHRNSRKIAKVTSAGEVLDEEVSGEGSTAVAVNLDSSSSEFDDVFINVGSVVEVFNPATAHVETFGELHPVSGSGIAVSSAGPVYVSDGAGDVVDVFTFGETPPVGEAPKTEAAGEVLGTTATFHGELNPKGATGRLEYRFDYNTDGSCAGGLSVPVPAGEVAEAKEALVEAKVTNLEPAAKYTYCLVAVNAFGFVRGSEVAFETSSKAPPLIISESTAVPVKATEATLQAQINPEKQETTYTFEYASSEAEVLAGKGTKLAGSGPLNGFSSGGDPVSAETGSVLRQNTTYYYRALAKNASGEEAVGKVEHFMTGIAPETPVVVSPVKSVTATTATLEGVLNPNAAGEPGSYELLYKASASECEGGETISGSESGGKGEAVKAEVASLLPYTAYTVCLRVSNDLGEVALSTPVTFMTLPVPLVVESESSTNVDATEARLQATIDPGNSETAYHFEYGPAEGFYDVSTPVREIKPGLTGVGVDVVLTGLTPGTTYHYRVVASNAFPGSVDGTDESFTTPATQPSGSPTNCPNEQLRAEQPYASVLPDCRAYEMVSPLETNGSDATDWFTQSAPRAAVSGEAVTYASFGNFAEPTGQTFENQFLSRRGPDGWSTQAITPLHQAEKGGGYPSYGAAVFTPELTEGITATTASLTGQAPVGQYVFGLYVDDFANHTYRYVGLNPVDMIPNPRGASTDLSHVVFDSSPFGSEGYPTDFSEWVNGKVLPVDVTNEGKSLEGYVGGYFYVNGPATRIPEIVRWRAVSDDGSRVYFTSPGFRFSDTEPAPIGQLYVRVNAEQPQSPVGSGEDCTVPTDACTIEVSASQRSVVDPHGPQQADYWSASADGSRVFFTSNQELTEDAYTGPADNTANLYEYDLERPAGERLKDLTVDKTDADGAAVQDVVQVSEDGSYVYFVADGDLGGRAVAGEPNLYVSHDDGPLVFIATLAAGDEADAVLSPNGSRLAFISSRSLTSYDNEQIGEIYLYDAETNGLVCASCNPSGARPVGSPSFTQGASRKGEVLYHSRNLLENGTLFFDSTDALVHHASDGRENVYEYKNGHIYPISDVAGGYESFFMDASANGENVFFGTADQLVRQDTSNNAVVYDARVDGGFPVSIAPQSCDNGDSCKPPPVPQPGVFGAPGSATFSGPGNIAPVVTMSPVVKAKAKGVKCKKNYVKKKNKCVRKFKKKKAKKSSDRKGSK